MPEISSLKGNCPTIMIQTLLFAIALLVSTVWIHAAGLGLLRLKIQRRSISGHLTLAITVLLILVLHIIEIGMFAAAIWFLNFVVDIGEIVGAREFSAMDYFYYSAETFTALGSGDLTVTGGLRLIAAIEPLNGLVLIAWTGAFTYWAMEHYWTVGKPTLPLKNNNGNCVADHSATYSGTTK